MLAGIVAKSTVLFLAEQLKKIDRAGSDGFI
jgi:hypothetical protein